MTQVPDGISVTSSVTIDYFELGRTVANADSEEQASFLLGMQSGFVYMGGNSALQMHYVADEMQRTGKNVHRLIERLHEYLGYGSELPPEPEPEPEHKTSAENCRMAPGAPTSSGHVCQVCASLE